MSARAAIATLILLAAHDATGQAPQAYPPPGPPPDRPAYRTVITRAENLIDAKESARAVRELEAVNCPDGDKDCVAHVRFATAYANDDLSVRTGRVDLAERALELYQTILADYPDDPQVLVNIARIQARLGQAADAAATFARAASAEPARARDYLLAAGDALRDAKQDAAATDHYLRAGDAGASEAWSRLVAMRQTSLAAASPEDQKGLLEESLALARDLRRRAQNGAALDALQTILRYAHQSAPDIAGVALAEWVEIQALNGTLSEAALDLLPTTTEWKSPMLQTLGDSIGSGEWRFGDGWNRDSHRYAALAAARAVADSLVASGDHARAAKLYERVVDGAYRRPTDGKPDLFLAAATQLARLYAVRRMLPELERLEDRLFAIKGEAYRTHDLAAMQRMHAVLGTIYEERGIWSSSYPARNATFQYARLVQVAKEREKKEGIFQPLPHYAEKAAEGYRREGRTKDARELEIDAARGYLDLDAVTQAQQALVRAADTGPAAGAVEDPRVMALRQIAAYRGRIAELPSTRGVAAPDWSGAPLDKDFLARQEFKAVSDLADRATERDEASEADTLYLHAFENALEQKVLIGTGDALRLERIRAAVDVKSPAIERTTTKPPQTTDPKPAPVDPKQDRTWKIQQSGAPAATVVWPAAVVEEGEKKAKDAARASAVKPPE